MENIRGKRKFGTFLEDASLLDCESLLSRETSKIIFYTTHCPKCEVLKRKLIDSNVEFEEFTDKKEMIKMKMMSSPMLSVNDTLLTFSEAIEWLKQQ